MNQRRLRAGAIRDWKGFKVKHKSNSFKHNAILEQSLLKQKAVQGNQSLARALSEKVEIKRMEGGDTLIAQGAEDHDVYFILAGRFEIIVDGHKKDQKGPGEHVGEMAAILTSLRRSATVRAVESGIVAKLSSAELSELSKKHKFAWRETRE